MKKILIFTEFFLPGFKGGGPILSISNLADLISSNFDITICTRNNDCGDLISYDQNSKEIVQKSKKYKIIYLSKMNIFKIFNIINFYQPDLLYLNGFFPVTTQIVIFLNQIKFKKPIILVPRGELLKNTISIKKFKKKIFIFFYKFLGLHKGICFQSTADNETKDIKNFLNISDDMVCQLPNVVETRDFQPLKKAKNELKVIFVSRISEKKNLIFALKVLQGINKNIIFDIYGPKEDMTYWCKCEEVINVMPSNIIVSYKGYLKQNEVISTMRNYHAFLCPTHGENFGYVIVQAMQSGLIPIISDQTPWLNLRQFAAGWSIPLKNYTSYVQAINYLYKMDEKEYSLTSKNAIDFINNNLSASNLKQDYLTYFNNIINKD